MKAGNFIAAGVAAASLLVPWSSVAAGNKLTNIQKYAYEWHDCIKNGDPENALTRCGGSSFPYMGVVDQISAKELKSAEFIRKITNIIQLLERGATHSGPDSQEPFLTRLENSGTEFVRQTFVNAAERQRLMGENETYAAIAATGIGLPGEFANRQSAGLKWVTVTGGRVPDNAINARGKGEPRLIICRAPESGELKTGWIENNGCKVHAYEAGNIDVYEVLTGDMNRIGWQQNIRGDDFPTAAYLNTEYLGANYFVCRAKNHKFEGDKYLGFGSYYPGTLKMSPNIEYPSCQAHPVDKRGVGGSHFEVMVLKNPEQKFEPEILWDW